MSGRHDGERMFLPRSGALERLVVVVVVALVALIALIVLTIAVSTGTTSITGVARDVALGPVSFAVADITPRRSSSCWPWVASSWSRSGRCCWRV